MCFNGYVVRIYQILTFGLPHFTLIYIAIWGSEYSSRDNYHCQATFRLFVFFFFGWVSPRQHVFTIHTALSFQNTTYNEQPSSYAWLVRVAIVTTYRETFW